MRLRLPGKILNCPSLYCTLWVCFAGDGDAGHVSVRSLGMGSGCPGFVEPSKFPSSFDENLTCLSPYRE